MIRTVIDRHRTEELSYQHVGWSMKESCPPGFHENRHVQLIGSGKRAFERAKEAICRLEMMKLRWFWPATSDPSLEVGSVVATVGRWWGVHSINVAKIVDVIDSEATMFGFAYGTTHAYPIRGEEAFRVVYDDKSDEVTYDIYSFARPRTRLMWLASPLIRAAQRRFCRESALAMQRFCESGSGSYGLAVD